MLSRIWWTTITRTNLHTSHVMHTNLKPTHRLNGDSSKWQAKLFPLCECANVCNLVLWLKRNELVLPALFFFAAAIMSMGEPACTGATVSGYTLHTFKPLISFSLIHTIFAFTTCLRCRHANRAKIHWRRYGVDKLCWPSFSFSIWYCKFDAKMILIELAKNRTMFSNDRIYFVDAVEERRKKI